MLSAGAHLRRLREGRGVSLEEIARSTRVQRQYLEALEADDPRDLPPPAFVRGFIRAYCQRLGAPPEEALRLYQEQTGEAPPVARPVAASARVEHAPTSRGREPVLVSLVLLVVLGVALFALTFALERTARHNVAPVRSLAPEDRRVGSEVATGMPDGAATAVERAPTDANVPPPPPTVAGGTPAPRAPEVTDPSATVNRLVARVREKTWMRVQTPDGRVTEELMNPGDIREWMSDRQFVVTIGNAGGITLELNGRELPPLGPTGQLVRRLVLPPDVP